MGIPLGKVSCAEFSILTEGAGSRRLLRLFLFYRWIVVLLGPGRKRITSFHEKTTDGSRYVNCGSYCLNRRYLSRNIAGVKDSLESEVCPGLGVNGFLGYTAIERWLMLLRRKGIYLPVGMLNYSLECNS